MKQVQLYTSQRRFVPSSALLDDFDPTAVIQVSVVSICAEVAANSSNRTNETIQMNQTNQSNQSNQTSDPGQIAT